MNFKIGSQNIGPKHQPFIILEAGINHNGDIEIAKQMIDFVKGSGADAIKFQTFKAKEFIANPDQEFTYQSQGETITESMLEMFERYQFSRQEWFELKKYCDDKGVIFMSTPQNISDLDLLLEIGVPALKVGSDDFTNLPLLEHYAATGLPLIISCGMADIGEVNDALSVTGALEGKPVALLLCTSQYPTPPADVNILKLKTLSAAFPNITLGFSDHSQGSVAATMAVACGAQIFEKHFTLDNNLPGPDHWFSENPATAKSWIHNIRTAYDMLGSPAITPTQEELEMRVLARRSVSAIRDIKPGEKFDETNIGLRRPGSGLPPKMIQYFWGQKSRHEIKAGSTLTFNDMA